MCALVTLYTTFDFPRATESYKATDFVGLAVGLAVEDPLTVVLSVDAEPLGAEAPDPDPAGHVGFPGVIDVPPA